VAACAVRGAEVAGGPLCHRGVGTLAWACIVRDTRPWAGIDGLVASGPNRRRAVLCSGPGQLHFVISMIFTHPNFEIRNGELPEVQNSLNFA
jgi:hypothetical protein